MPEDQCSLSNKNISSVLLSTFYPQSLCHSIRRGINELCKQTSFYFYLCRAPVTPRSPAKKMSEGARSSFFVNFKVPEMPHDVRKLLEENNKTVTERKWRRKVVAHLYDNIVQIAL